MKCSLPLMGFNVNSCDNIRGKVKGLRIPTSEASFHSIETPRFFSCRVIVRAQRWPPYLQIKYLVSSSFPLPTFEFWQLAEVGNDEKLMNYLNSLLVISRLRSLVTLLVATNVNIWVWSWSPRLRNRVRRAMFVVVVVEATCCYWGMSSGLRGLLLLNRETNHLPSPTQLAHNLLSSPQFLN